MRKKRVLSLVLALSLVLGAVPAFGTIGVGATEGTAPWEKKEPSIATQWYDEIGEYTIPLDEYPDPQFEREEWMNLNGLWAYQGGSTAAEPETYSQTIMVPYPIESALSGIMEHHDYSWYRRTFTIPEEWDEDARIILHFEASDWQTTVYVNGEKAMYNDDGYAAFSGDITEYLQPGENELKVMVYDDVTAPGHTIGKQTENPGGIYFDQVSGIWGTVWMEPVSATHMESLKMETDVDNSALGLTVEQAGSGEATVDVEIKAGDRTVVTQTGLSTGERHTIGIPEEELYLWSPDTPFLYDITLTMKSGGEVVDTVKSYFGMRKIEVKDTGERDSNGAIQGIYLNDEEIFSLGFLDQSYWPESLYTPPTDEAIRWDIEAQKELGMNFIRLHIKVNPKRWYYYCDKIGIMVWQDMPNNNGMSFEEFQPQVENMVTSHWNHPSIVNWILYNESWGQHTAAETIQLTEDIQELDPSRLVTAASGWNDVEAGDIKDTHSYPGPWADPSATRVRICGECSVAGVDSAVLGHVWDPDTNRDYIPVEDLPKAEYVEGVRHQLDTAAGLKQSIGMKGAVLTEFDDIEQELGGIWTYDRKIAKLDVGEYYGWVRDVLFDGAVQKDSPEDAIGRVSLHDQARYSSESWAVVESAQAHAQAVLESEKATHLEVYEAAKALYTALDDLYVLGSGAVDKTALNAAIQEANLLEGDDYTDESWAELEAALATALGVKSRKDATQQQADDAAAALEQALDQLAFRTVDKSALQAAIDEGRALDQATFTPQSWAPFAEALADAEVVNRDPAVKQSAVNRALKALEAAREELVGIGVVRYEAEDARLSQYVNTEENANFSNGKFVRDLVPIASVHAASDIAADWSNVRYMRYTVDSTLAGIYKLTLAYSTDSGATVYVRLNDQSADEYLRLQQPAGAGWDTLMCPEYEIHLPAGTSEIWISGATGDMGSADWINFDYIELTLLEADPGQTDKTELGKLIEEAQTYTEEGWLPNTWVNLVAVLESAIRVYNDPDATALQVVTLTESLRGAIDMLEPIAGPGQLGDVNDDGRINSSDARLVLQATVNLITLSETQKAAADCNGDEKINSNDARWILQETVSQNG